MSSLSLAPGSRFRRSRRAGRCLDALASAWGRSPPTSPPNERRNTSKKRRETTENEAEMDQKSMKNHLKTLKNTWNHVKSTWNPRETQVTLGLVGLHFDLNGHRDLGRQVHAAPHGARVPVVQMFQDLVDASETTWNSSTFHHFFNTFSTHFPSFYYTFFPLLSFFLLLSPFFSLGAFGMAAGVARLQLVRAPGGRDGAESWLWAWHLETELKT